jgi:5-methylcytosine-specific restriction endonuclease McrA
MRVLVLTPSYVPHQIVSWERAVMLFFAGKVDVVDSYDEELRAPSLVMKHPAVVVLKRPPRSGRRSVKFSRANVFARDGYRCQYCGSPKQGRELSYDHVVPRHRGGRTTWDNIVASCLPCNHRKGSRTPEQAGMRLLRAPIAPKSLPLAPPRFDARDLPRVWSEWVRGFYREEAVA